jgi:GAF domain-containing protein
MLNNMQVPAEIMRKWQEIVDLLADILNVPSALIMRAEPPNIKVFVSSESNGNPYEPDEVACHNTGLYCETVMNTRRPLIVPDALKDEALKSNPDIKLGMISYLGVPISWPCSVKMVRSVRW